MPIHNLYDGEDKKESDAIQPEVLTGDETEQEIPPRPDSQAKITGWGVVGVRLLCLLGVFVVAFLGLLMLFGWLVTGAAWLITGAKREDVRQVLLHQWRNIRLGLVALGALAIGILSPRLGLSVFLAYLLLLLDKAGQGGFVRDLHVQVANIYQRL